MSLVNFVPIRSAPALIIDKTTFKLVIPPEAFTFILPVAIFFKSLTSCTVAPLILLKPVDVLTKEAPASMMSFVALTFSSSFNNPVSMITFTTLPFAIFTISEISSFTKS